MSVSGSRSIELRFVPADRNATKPPSDEIAAWSDARSDASPDGPVAARLTSVVSWVWRSRV